MSGRRRAPRLLARGLGWMIPSRVRSEVLEDLDHLYGRRRCGRYARGSRLRADLWYAGAIVGYLRLRFGPRLPDALAPAREGARMSHLVQDIRFALRSLSRAPGFVAVAAITLGLGVGVNTTIFSLVNALLFRPLPVQAPERLVEIYSFDGAVDTPVTSSYADYLDLQERVAGLEGIAAYAMMTANLRRDDRSSLIYGEMVSGNYFELLGVRPLLGRLIEPADDRSPGGHPVAVVGFRFWQDRLSGAADILGQTLALNGIPHTVIGVAPADFPGLVPTLSADLFVPTMMATGIDPVGVQSSEGGAGNRVENRGSRWLMLKGRLRPDATVERVAAEVEATMADLARIHPQTNHDWGSRVVSATSVRIHPMADRIVTAAATAVQVMVGLVLLIACVNLANMSLSRATGRGQEIAIRAALGAGRARLLSQLLTESMVLAAVGGVLGLGLTVWVTGLLVAAQPPLPVPLNLDIRLDGRVLAFTLGLTVVSAVASGLGPALQASRRELVPALRDSRRCGDGGARLALRNTLVAAQVAICVVLLVGGFLLVRSLQSAQSVDLGFDADDLAIVSVNLDLHGYERDEARAFFERAGSRLEALPGVAAVGLASRMPLALGFNVQALYLPGHQQNPDDAGYQVDATIVDGGYFEALELRPLEGRTFTDADTPESTPVAVVNRTLAERYWPDGAVGRTFRTGGPDGRETEIVGVVPDTRVRTVGEEPRPYVHYSREQSATTLGTFAVRFRGDPESTRAAIRRELLALEPELVLTEDTTMRGLLAVALFPVRVAASLLAGFGVLALVLAAVGLYGVIAYSVSRRTREIGIRMALGAQRRDVRVMVLRQGLRVVLVGAAVGASAAALLAGGLRSVLYGVGTLDPMAFGAAIGVLLAVALAANAVPAMRATRVDPAGALRAE